MVMLKNTKEPERAGPIQVAFYIRVSTDKQAQLEDGSIDTQLDRLQSFIDYKRKQGENWVVAEKLVEGEKDGKRHGKSGKNAKRPAYQKLLALAEARMIDVVVATRLDRISRNVADFLGLVATLERHQVKLVSLRENIDLTTPAGRLITIVLMALGQYEREMTSSRVSDKVAWRAEKGLPIGPPGIGYKMKDKLYAADEPYASHVRAAEALYLERESVDRIVPEFRKRGYRTPSGKFYTKQVLCRMLRSPSYAAKIEHKGKLHDAQWKPIRSWENHQRIQQMMDKNDRRKRSEKRQSRDYVYLLQGLLRCGLCGHKMSPRPGRGRSGEYYPYYFCGQAEKSVGGECPRVYVPAVMLDRGVLAFMKELHLKPERIRTIAERSNETNSEVLTKLMADLERVRTQLASVRSKLSRLVDVLTESGKDALASVRERMEALERERAELEETEARLKSEYAAEKAEVIVAADAIKALEQFHELVAEVAEEPDRLKALLSRFVDYVVWHAAEKGEGKLEVALFTDPVELAAGDVAARAGDPQGPRFAGESQMVGPAGFEPATCCSQSSRAEPGCATGR